MCFLATRHKKKCTYKILGKFASSAGVSHNAASKPRPVDLYIKVFAIGYAVNEVVLIRRRPKLPLPSSTDLVYHYNSSLSTLVKQELFSSALIFSVCLSVC